MSAHATAAPPATPLEAETGAAADGTAPDPKGADIDIGRIMQLIPHRYPFLLIDRVVDVTLGEAATGIKNVTIGDHFFQGHYPGYPVMPGVLIIEAMAQTAAVLVVETLGQDAQGKVVYFMSVNDAKFRRPVHPGDRLYLHVSKERRRGPVWKMTAVARVDGATVAEATYTAMIMDSRPDQIGLSVPSPA